MAAITHSQNRTRRLGVAVGLLVAIVALPGCGRLGWLRPGADVPVDVDEPKTQAESPPPKKSDAPTELASGAWVERVVHPDDLKNAAGAPPATRWRHAGLEGLLAHPPTERPDFAPWLDDANATIAGNAAIALARQNNPSAQSRLAATVREAKVGLPMRLAAAEALGLLKGAQVDAAIAALLDEFGAHTGDARSRYLPELHAELLASSVGHASADRAAQLAIALRSQAADVRQAALVVYQKDTALELPDTLIELQADQDPRIRRQLVATLTARRRPKASEVCIARLGDSDLTVRAAAIEGLGRVGDEAACEKLSTLVKSQPEVLRAGAVRALAAAGHIDQAAAAKEDTSSQVRLALAESLADAAPSIAVPIATAMLADRSGPVTAAVVASASHWDLKHAGPILLAALELSSVSTRRAAAEALSAKWPAAAEFSATAGDAQRAKSCELLTAQWRSEFGALPATPSLAPSTDEPIDASLAESTTATKKPAPPDAKVLNQVRSAVARLAAAESSSEARRAAVDSLESLQVTLLPALELLAAEGLAIPDAVYQDVLPTCDERASLVARLWHDDANDRRQAAAALAKLGNDAPLSGLLLTRVVAAALRDSDGLAWASLQQALAIDQREPTIQLQSAAASHPAANVRKGACEYFGRFPSPQSATLLNAMLADDNSDVVRAAVVALGQAKKLEQPLSLARLLASRDKELRLAVAQTLIRHQQPGGAEALVRLAHDEDPQTRRNAAVAMGQTSQRIFVPELMRLLDDQLGVKTAAVKSLASIVGRDVGQSDAGTAAGLDEQIRRWRAWHQREKLKG